MHVELVFLTRGGSARKQEGGATMIEWEGVSVNIGPKRGHGPLSSCQTPR